MTLYMYQVQVDLISIWQHQQRLWFINFKRKNKLDDMFIYAGILINFVNYILDPSASKVIYMFVD